MALGPVLMIHNVTLTEAQILTILLQTGDMLTWQTAAEFSRSLLHQHVLTGLHQWS